MTQASPSSASPDAMRYDKQKMRHLIHTAQGQLNALSETVEKDGYCIDISNQLQASIAVLKRANREVISAHIQGCVKEAVNTDKAEEKIDEILKLLQRMS